MKFIKNNKNSLFSGILKYSSVLVIALSLFMSAGFVQADTNCDGPSQPKCSTTPPNGGTEVSVKIENPLAKNGINNIQGFIGAIINVVLVVGVPIITLAIIYSGFLFIQA
ncbi:MAG: hypothetical protein WCK91_02820, partial [bacterium]